MTISQKMKPITPSYDPWEAYMDLEEYGKLLLTNVEFTTTTLCNMRCWLHVTAERPESASDGSFIKTIR